MQQWVPHFLSLSWLYWLLFTITRTTPLFLPLFFNAARHLQHKQASHLHHQHVSTTCWCVSSYSTTNPAARTSCIHPPSTSLATSSKNESEMTHSSHLRPPWPPPARMSHFLLAFVLPPPQRLPAARTSHFWLVLLTFVLPPPPWPSPARTSHFWLVLACLCPPWLPPARTSQKWLILAHLHLP